MNMRERRRADVNALPMHNITILVDGHVYSSRNAKATTRNDAILAVLLRVIQELHTFESGSLAVSELGNMSERQVELDKLAPAPDLTQGGLLPDDVQRVYDFDRTA